MAIGANINLLIQTRSDIQTKQDEMQTLRETLRSTRQALIADVQDANDNGTPGVNGGNPGFLLDGTHIYSNGVKQLMVTFNQAAGTVTNVSLVREGADTNVVTL